MGRCTACGMELSLLIFASGAGQDWVDRRLELEIVSSGRVLQLRAAVRYCFPRSTQINAACRLPCLVVPPESAGGIVMACGLWVAQRSSCGV
jgi:hypothetical protein